MVMGTKCGIWELVFRLIQYSLKAFMLAETPKNSIMVKLKEVPFNVWLFKVVD